MRYFTINELCKSATATSKRIDNSPNAEISFNLELLVDKVLDPLRDKYGKPIKINSGYRCEDLNKAVGGSKTSQHRCGLAADITAGSKLENKKLFILALELDLPFDLLIDENDYSWIHVSYRQNPRKQILHL